MAQKTDSKNSGRSDEPKFLDAAAQLVLIKDEIERFTRMSREKGFITVEELNDLLPAEIIDAGVLDSFMSALDSAGVIITEPSQKKEGDEEGATFLADPDAEEEEKDEDEEKSEDEDMKGNDPVRLYLRKMGSVSLLTREGEVEIARRIEKGEREIVRAILLSPIGTTEIIQLGVRLDQGRIKVKAIFRGLEDEETQYDEQEYIEKVHSLIDEVKKYQKKAMKPFSVLREEGLNNKSKQEAEKEMFALNAEVMGHFESINFNRKTINRIVIKFKNLLNRMTVLRRRTREGLQKTFTDTTTKNRHTVEQVFELDHDAVDRLTVEVDRLEVSHDFVVGFHQTFFGVLLGLQLKTFLAKYIEMFFRFDLILFNFTDQFVNFIDVFLLVVLSFFIFETPEDCFYFDAALIKALT